MSLSIASMKVFTVRWFLSGLHVQVSMFHYIFFVVCVYTRKKYLLFVAFFQIFENFESNNIEFAGYNNKTPYTCAINIEKVLEPLENSLNMLFELFW